MDIDFKAMREDAVALAKDFTAEFGTVHLVWRDSNGEYQVGTSLGYDAEGDGARIIFSTNLEEG